MLVFADDVTALAPRNFLEGLQTGAHMVVGSLRRMFGALALALNGQKTHSMLFAPYFLPDGIYKRTKRLYFPVRRQRPAAQYRLEGARGRTVVEFDPERAPPPHPEVELPSGPPFPLGKGVKAAGIVLDRFKALGQ